MVQMSRRSRQIAFTGTDLRLAEEIKVKKKKNEKKKKKAEQEKMSF